MKKDEKKYHILVIEDNIGDFMIVEDHLHEKILFPVIIHAQTYQSAFTILDSGKYFDIILMDLSLPDKSGEQLVTEMLQLSTVCCPVIILTGYSDINFSIKAVSQGISDYLIKDDLNAAILYKSITYAIERKKNISELEKSQKQYSDLFNLSPQSMWVYDSETYRFIKVNKACLTVYGYSEAEFMNMSLLDIKQEEDHPKSLNQIKTNYTQNTVFNHWAKHRKKNGDIIEVELFSTIITINQRQFNSEIAIDVTEKKQFENKITRAIIKTQEDERYEIGGELHDNVCQILAAGQLCIGMLNNSVPEERIHLLHQCNDHIKMALNEIRNLSHRLAPAFFDYSNLEEAFNTLFGTFHFDEQTEIILYFDESAKNDSLSMEIRLNLYRIMQEQLRNILKYAKATIIKVMVQIQHQHLIMQIIDNGIGFNPDTAINGIGLANMKRRTELFSGNFQIKTSPGNGCTIIVEIPLPKK